MAGRHPVYRQKILDLIADESLCGGAWCATKADIARMIGCSVKTADRAIHQLKCEGLITIDPHYDERGGQRANSYRVVTTRGTEAAQPLGEGPLSCVEAAQAGGAKADGR